MGDRTSEPVVARRRIIHGITEGTMLPGKVPSWISYLWWSDRRQPWSARQRLVRHYIDSTMGNRDQGEEVELLGRVHLVLFGVLQKEVIAALVAAGLAMRGGFDLDPGDPLAVVHQEIVLAVVADRDRWHQPLFESSKGEELLAGYADCFRGWRTLSNLSHKPSGMSESQPCWLARFSKMLMTSALFDACKRDL